MSVDPVGLTGAAVSALIDAELNALAADAAALQSQLQPGDVVSATVLPSNGLTDLVLINGNRVAASLPPTLHPGDVIQVQVTAFDGPQILLQMLEAEAGAAAAAGTPPGTPGGTSTATPTGSPATGTAAATNATLAGAAPSSAPGAAAPGAGSITPTAVFLVAAVRASDSLPAPPPAPIGGAPTNLILPPAAKPSSVAFPLVTGSEPSSIEARMAAARTGVPPPTPPAPALVMRTVAPPALPQVSTPAGLAAQAASATAASRAFVTAPQISAASRQAPTGPQAALPAAPTPPAASTNAPPLGLAAYRDPVTLVRALRLPVTPTTVAAAKLGLESPQRLPNALATLAAALPNDDDPRVATLRAVSAFVGRIDPNSPELASQLASYVEHVVDGGEPKLVLSLASQLLAEQLVPTGAQTAPPTGAPAGAATPGENAAAAAPAAAGDAPPEPALPVVLLADAALRAAGLVHDLKSALMSILAAPPAAGGDELAASAASALTAVTGVQLGAANAMAQNPQTIAFTIPLWNGSGYSQAQLQVDRDAPDSKGTALDGDNFHIAFILDTKNLGTVAIDLRTVGRAVNIAVKTQALPAAERFADSLSRLTDRLTHLRYRVAATEAAVARPATAPATPVQAPVIPEDPPEGMLDSRA